MPKASPVLVVDRKQVHRKVKTPSPAAAAFDDATSSGEELPVPAAYVLPKKKKTIASKKLLSEVIPTQSPRKRVLPATRQVNSPYVTHLEGSGVHTDPWYMPLRKTGPNQSGCLACPTDICLCEAFARCLDEAKAEVGMKRIDEVAGKKVLCAKSLNPLFVAQLVPLMDITEKDTFYDLGSGNGSILFQVALLTGAKCIGIEISEHNAELSRRLWAAIRPKLQQLTTRPLPDVIIETGSFEHYIPQIKPDDDEAKRAKKTFKTKTASPFGAVNEHGRPIKVLISNLIWPLQLTHYLSEVFADDTTASGTTLFCMSDLYPHSREIMRHLYPELYTKFTMEDYRWSVGAVEWTFDTGLFYIHRKN